MQAGMDEHDRAALVEHCQQWIELRVAEKIFTVAREQRDPGEFESIERISNLVERALDAPYRHRAERAKALGPTGDELGRVIVATSRQRLCARLAAEADAGLRYRGERDLDAGCVHQVEREWRRPVRIPADGRPPAGGINRLAVERRNEVEMNVDPAR